MLIEFNYWIPYSAKMDRGTCQTYVLCPYLITVLMIRNCLSPFSLAFLEKLTVANVCSCSNDYA